MQVAEERGAKESAWRRAQELESALARKVNDEEMRKEEVRRREEALEVRIAKAGEELEMLQAALDEKTAECSEYCSLVNI